jgi:hypothetical protein
MKPPSLVDAIEPLPDAPLDMTDELQLLERRVEQLERDVSALRTQAAITRDQPWWQRIAGRFENDPIFDEIVRLGSEYRQSLRPKEALRLGPRPPISRRRRSVPDKWRAGRTSASSVEPRQPPDC